MAIIDAPDVPRLIVDQQRNLSELFPAVGSWTMAAEGDGFQLVASFPHPRKIVIPLSLASARELRDAIDKALSSDT
jgi:hypothetical protein